MNWCRRFLYRIYRLIFKKRKSIRDEVFYINGSDTLPPPLTKEEEAADDFGQGQCDEGV